jgi:protein-tyrosine phosphatase
MQGSALADLHCHILPGIDDGALDEADSLEMARQAAADGIAAVCATPHIRHDHDVRIHELEGRVADLQRALDDARIPVRVATGGEVAQTALDGLSEEELQAVSLGGGGRWILLEPAPGPLGPELVAAVDQLAAGGRRAVVAHPERHPGEGFEEILTQVLERDALVQATAAHLLDDLAPRMLELFAAGLLQLVGSDAHSARFGRRLELSAALGRLEPASRQFAAAAPAALLRGEDP